MTIPTLTGAWSGQRRSWLLAGCAGLLALVFLLSWTAYAANGLVVLGRQHQLEPGQPASVRGADHRLLILRSTEVITDQGGDRSETVAANASWVVAELEVTRRVSEPEFFCGFELVGPDRRRWEPDGPTLTRTLPSYCRAEDMVVGRPHRLEVIFTVPNRFLDQIYGVAVVDHSGKQATPVLRPG